MPELLSVPINLSESHNIWEKMLIATKDGDVVAFHSLLADPRLRHEDLSLRTTTSLLYEACKIKSPDIGLKLLELGVDPASEAESALHSLHAACTWSNGTSLIEALIKAGASVKDVDESGWTPLHFAALANDPACINILLDHGADVLARDNEKWTPLHTAMNTGCIEAATALLARGARLDLLDDRGLTPAGRALLSNQTDEALWLVAIGLKPSKADLLLDPHNRFLKLTPPVAAAKGGCADVLIGMMADGRIDPLDKALMKRLRSVASRAGKDQAVATLDAGRAQTSIQAIRLKAQQARALVP